MKGNASFNKEKVEKGWLVEYASDLSGSYAFARNPGTSDAQANAQVLLDGEKPGGWGHCIS
ncbi:MAG: hypothetical protein AABZ39_02905 [Spirochaetota bacterium]